MQNREQLDVDVKKWLSSLKGKEISCDELAKDPQAIALKARCLEAFEAWKKMLEKEGKPIPVEIKSSTPEIREKIGKLIYEGNVNDELLIAAVSDEGEEIDGASNSCMGCVGCVACSSCSACAVCIITGVSAAAITTATASTASTATAGSR